jgi:uncharacterized protein (DUF2147 family)
MRRTILCGMMLVAALGTARAAGDPVGEWVVQDGSARIGIDMCDGKLWGVITWEKSPGTDSNNPDPSKRQRPTLGIPILVSMAPGGDQWQGQIYNAENGKMYSGKVSLQAADKLRIEGCLFTNFLCGGQTWTRYAKPAAAAAPARPPQPGGRPAASAVCAAVGRSGASH